jgi:hypothetical protein
MIFPNESPSRAPHLLRLRDVPQWDSFVMLNADTLPLFHLDHRPIRVIPDDETCARNCLAWTDAADVFP